MTSYFGRTMRAEKREQTCGCGKITGQQPFLKMAVSAHDWKFKRTCSNFAVILWISIFGFLHWIPYSSAVDTNDCWNNPCDNEGVCIDEFQSFRCECPVLYNGTRCENYIGGLGCVIRPCQNGATCLPRTPEGGNLPFTCDCVPGYTGTLCETDMDECESTANACLNSGRCVDGINTYTCNCTETGYEGPNCNININECLTFDCGMGAPCRDFPGSFTCDCPDGYTDTPCRRVNACDTKPCKNQGVCEDQDNGYTCSCLLGYTGRDCETVIDRCANVTCPGEHVTCQNGLASYSCICAPGYIGSPGNCTDFDECSTRPCQNGGTCTNLVNAFSCNCPRGFNGTTCQDTNNNCASRPCLNGGSCTDGLGDFSCECIAGYTGKDCSTNIDDCAVSPEPCRNGGTCQDQINGNTCDCPPGYTGFSCESDIDECVGNPCLNQGTCRNEINSYLCDCAPGFTDLNCSVNIDDCVPEPCHNSGTCTDGVMAYTCNCTDQWMGQNCTELYDACSFKPCKNNGTCSSTLGSRDYNCSCVTGYTGTDCETNIDDCAGVTCAPFQICFDGLNSHRCDCPKGFSGANCSTNIDECSTFPCRNNATCDDGVGTYTCNCQVETVNLTRYMRPGASFVFETGFTGRNCEIDINECDHTPGVCLHDGECRNKPGGYTCFCGNEELPGSLERVYYTGTNCEITTNYCQVADEARFDPPVCKNNGTCKGGDGKFKCECVPGFNGTRCEHNIDDCAKFRLEEGREPCENNGTCHDGINAYRCECILGITGFNCSVNIDDCKSGPCDNGGRCTDAINDYSCDCQDTGFTGQNCTENINDCEVDLCQNGAECIDGIKDYNCSCFPGYSGKNCDYDIQECTTTTPCQNGGSCLERSLSRYYPNNPIPGNFSYATAGGYFCICKDGFNGSSCENDIDECLLTSEPCLNGGTCRDAVNGYTCSCATGFQGDRCESEVNECLVYHPCRNGATCIDRVADYDCQCLPSLNRIVYGGKNCTTELTGCHNNRCQNNAVCVPNLENEAEGRHNYTCDCKPGWAGYFCSVDTSVSFFGNSYIYQLGSVSNITQRIRTSVSDGVVTLIGSTGQNFISLELWNGQPCIFVPPDFGPKFPCLPVRLDDGVWHEVKVELLPGSISLSVLNDQQCDTMKCQESVLKDPPQEDVVFGGVGIFGDILNQTFTKKNYIGCIQDMKIDNALFISSEIPTNQKQAVDSGCSRVEQCPAISNILFDSNSACQRHGACVDNWFSPKCVCRPPYYGDTCGQEIPPVTFSPGDNTSLVRFIADPQRVNVSLTEQNLSLFFTTRKDDGVLFFMGRRLTAPDAACNQFCNYFLLQLQAGMVCLKYRVCNSGNQTHCSPTGLKYSDGNSHFLEMRRSGTEISLLIDTIVIYETSLSRVGVLCEVHSDYLVFGNLPSVGTQRKKRQTENPSIYDGATNFKGVIQDVRLNDNLMMFYPLAAPDPSLPQPFPASSGTDTTVQGIVSDDICATTTPCQNNATCTNVDYNDYNCSCAAGYAGKDCDLADFCRQSPCPENSTCNSLRGGYECVTPATFDSNGLQYRGAIGIDSDLNSISLRLRTRELTGVILSLRNRVQTSEFFIVELRDGAIQVSYSLDAEGVKRVRTGVRVSDAVWYSIKVEHFSSSLRVSVDGAAVMEATNTIKTLSDLIKGTAPNQINSTDLMVGNDPLIGQPFIGCLDEIRLGGILLPFYSDSIMQIPAVNNATKRFTLSTPQGVKVGCSSRPVCGVTSPVCLNNASCSDLWNKFECNCTAGWEGETCADNIDDCVNNDCQNGATCLDELNNYTCDCVPGFYGWRCEAQTNECENLPCNNSGICIDLVNDFQCNCTANYTGKVCDILITETCDREPCMNGATCQDYNVTISGQEVARFNCSCAPGYEGRVCADEIDYCAETPCYYGTCVSNVTLLDYTCFCQPGYTDKNCSTEIDECDPQPCKNGATCNDFVNAYNCSCTAGWEGFDCDLDIPECNRTENACGPWGRCIEQPGSYDCDCDPGFRANKSDDCGTSDRCQVVVVCKDIDECTEGFCKNGASCSNFIGNYSCNCTLGYDGENCDIGNCSYNQCLQGSTCHIDPVTNRWRCECLPFYDGDQCDIIGPCVAAPCQNGATCKQNITDMTYICECPPGFDGDNCTEDIDECLEDNPCLNNATCNNTYGSYKCDCQLGFTGRDCETNINDCADTPCKNAGVCIDLVNGFQCNCSRTGFEGETCEVDIDECEIEAPCQHSSTCVNKPGGFSCKCPETHEGQFCETARATGEDDSDKIGIIIGVVVGFIVLVAIICLVVLIVLARNKRATRGTYSPSRQEMSGSRVELGHVIKPPPEERLI